MGFFSNLFGGNEDAEPIEAVDLSNAVRKACRIVGRVQGVGCRFFVQSNAKNYKVTGWVKNMSDGAVTMELQGDAQSVDKLIAKIKLGNDWIKVNECEVNDLPVVANENTFAIRY
ncbi:MAG: acylphosphatase [Selenomonadaceae bacterium]|nr:acylphosphatase [Selenomonadaceae bacterium]